MINLIAPHDAWLAYQFDQAVSFLGRYLDNKLSQFDDKGRPKHALEELLADAAPVGTRGKYASPGRKREW